jgi:hypothetical protein
MKEVLKTVCEKPGLGFKNRIKDTQPLTLGSFKSNLIKNKKTSFNIFYEKRFLKRGHGQIMHRPRGHSVSMPSTFFLPWTDRRNLAGWTRPVREAAPHVHQVLDGPEL